MEAMFGVPSNAQEALIDPRILLLALVLGVGTSMIAAWIPARSAACVEPMQALQKGKYQVLSAGENRLRRNAALVSGVLALFCVVFSRYRLVFFLDIF